MMRIIFFQLNKYCTNDTFFCFVWEVLILRFLAKVKSQTNEIVYGEFWHEPLLPIVAS